MTGSMLGKLLKSFAGAHIVCHGARAQRVEIGRADRIEADGAQLLAVDAEPAKPHASCAAIEPDRFDIDLERHALQPGRIAEMVEITQEIFDLEPDHRLTVGASRGDFPPRTRSIQQEMSPARTLRLADSAHPRCVDKVFGGIVDAAAGSPTVFVDVELGTFRPRSARLRQR
jgi:hypothetical protein